MTADQLAVRPSPDDPAVEVTRRGDETIVVLRGWAGGACAVLDPRLCRLVAATLRNVLDARAIGGMSVTIELPLDPGAGARAAASLIVSSAASGLVLSMIGRNSLPLAAARLDQASIDALSGDRA